MATQTTALAPPRVLPPVLDAPKNAVATTAAVLLVGKPHERVARALEEQPLRLLVAPTPEAAFAFASTNAISAVLADADDSLDLLQRLRLARPSLSVLLWQGSAAGMAAAVNQ